MTALEKADRRVWVGCGSRLKSQPVIRPTALADDFPSVFPSKYPDQQPGDASNAVRNQTSVWASEQTLDLWPLTIPA